MHQGEAHWEDSQKAIVEYQEEDPTTWLESAVYTDVFTVVSCRNFDNSCAIDDMYPEVPRNSRGARKRGFSG
jgi:hypothetical protein